MIKILDLCAGTQSVRKALTKKFKIVHWERRNETRYFGHTVWTGPGTPTDNAVVEYRGVDIYSPEGTHNIIHDLTQENVVENLVKKIGSWWKPDFIWASPVCNKFSAATTGPGGNTYFIVENEQIRPRKEEEYIYVKHNKFNQKPENWATYVEEANIAMKLHESIRDIIKYYNVPFAIENPANALSKYIYKGFERNVAHYCAYGFEYKKPTAIYTNKQLNLRKHSDDETQRHLKFDRINQTTNWPAHWDRNVSTYANRSSVPPQLIKEIIEKLLTGEQ